MARVGALPIESKTDNRVCFCLASSISTRPDLGLDELITGMANAERRTNDANLVCSAALNGLF
jgi:hypothetical protein